MSNKALLIVDVQVMPFIWKDYGGKAIYQEAQLLGNISKLIDKARAASIPVIYVQYTEGEDSQRAQGKPLWEVHPQISPQPEDLRVVKYSADPFYQTKLHEQLKAIGVDSLVITGVQTEYCVDTTCRTAFSLGYKNVLVSDGHSTYDSSLLTAEQIIRHHNYIIGNLFAELKTAGEVEF
jgi:nicotinamidase-related amidase